AGPAGGTVLTVLREGGEAGAEAAAGAAAGAAATKDAGGGIPNTGGVLDAALAAARASLARTTETLPALRAAGVVDAGGKGVVLLLDAMRSAVVGVPASEPVGPIGPVGLHGRPSASGLPAVVFGFEVQYLLEAP